MQRIERETRSLLDCFPFHITYGIQIKAIGLITVFDTILMSRQTRLEITVFEWKSNIKYFS